MISGGFGNQSAVEAGKLADQPQTASKTEQAIRGIPDANNKIVDFEAVIEEIDKDLSDTLPSLNATVAEIVRELKGRALEENKHGYSASMGGGGGLKNI